MNAEILGHLWKIFDVVAEAFDDMEDAGVSNENLQKSLSIVFEVLLDWEGQIQDTAAEYPAYELGER